MTYTLDHFALVWLVAFPSRGTRTPVTKAWQPERRHLTKGNAR